MDVVGELRRGGAERPHDGNDVLAVDAEDLGAVSDVVAPRRQPAALGDGDTDVGGDGLDRAPGDR